MTKLVACRISSSYHLPFSHVFLIISKNAANRESSIAGPRAMGRDFSIPDNRPWLSVYSSNTRTTTTVVSSSDVACPANLRADRQSASAICLADSWR